MSDTSLPVHEQYKSWMIHFFLFMNGLSTQCRKQSIMWENILMIVHEWCFYLRSWTSTFNPFMNGSFLPVHEWFNNVGEYFDDHSWMMLLSSFMNVDFQPVHEWYIFILSWMAHLVKKPNHSLGDYFDDHSYMMIFSRFMNVHKQPIHERFIFAHSWTVHFCTFMNGLTKSGKIFWGSFINCR